MFVRALFTTTFPQRFAERGVAGIGRRKPLALKRGAQESPCQHKTTRGAGASGAMAPCIGHHRAGMAGGGSTPAGDRERSTREASTFSISSSAFCQRHGGPSAAHCVLALGTRWRAQRRRMAARCFAA